MNYPSRKVEFDIYDYRLSVCQTVTPASNVDRHENSIISDGTAMGYSIISM